MDIKQDLWKAYQLSIVFWYISITENHDDVPKQIKIYKFLLGFISVANCTSKGPRTQILITIEEYGIYLSERRGQGHDGA